MLTTPAGKKTETSEKDIISNLPSEIKLKILSHLTTKEAAKTCVLSRAWRHQWSRVPSLEFDLRKPSIRSFHVDSALLLHDAPIHSFKISIRSTYVPDESGPLFKWLRHLSRKGIQDFTLKSDGNEIGFRYPVPSSLFSCNDLTHLTLRNCELSLPPTFRGFRKLKSLDLHSVTVLQTYLEKLIATSPLLERLKLKHLQGSTKRLKIDAPNLRFLKLRGNSQHDVDLTKTLNLVHHVSLEPKRAYDAKWDRLLGITPAIRELEISFNEFFIPVNEEGMTSWSFPSLQRLKVTRFRRTKFDLNLIKLLILSCPNLQDLQVASSYSKSKLRELGYYYFNLSYDASSQVLKVTGLYGHKFELELIKFLLLSSPLQELHILFDDDMIERRTMCRKQGLNDDYDDATSCKGEGGLKLNHLRVTHIRGFTRAKDEVRFIKFALTRAARLEELTMQPQCDRVPWEVTKLLNELKCKVNVKLLDPLEASDEKPYRDSRGRSPDNYSGNESYDIYGRLRRRRKRRKMRSPVYSSSSSSNSSDSDSDRDDYYYY